MSLPTDVSSRGEARPALRLAAVGGILAVLLAFGIAVAAPRGLVPGLALHLLGLVVAVRGAARSYPHDRIGACNVVTTIRLALVGGVVALALEGGPGWAMAAVAGIALILDGADGWLARRQGLVSDFGARYDMEVDAALAACLAVALLAAGRAGPELLVLGFARYAFVGAARALPWLTRPLAGSFRRKVVCVVQIGTLVLLAAPILSDASARLLALSASTLLLWSFARDIRRLARAR